MSHPAPIKATHKAIQTYYQALQDYREHHVEHETALRSAFQNLLAETAKVRHWLLVPEQGTRTGGKRVVPDGTLCDDFNLHRGYWEAKDTDDHLDAEIAKKIKKGYPLTTSFSRIPGKRCCSRANAKCCVSTCTIRKTSPTCSISSTPTPSRSTRTSPGRYRGTHL